MPQAIYSTRSNGYSFISKVDSGVIAFRNRYGIRLKSVAS